MKKILPFCDNPIIKTYPYIAFYLGILEGNGVDVTKLLIKEFSNIFFFRGKIDFVASGFFHKKYFYCKPNRFFIKKNIENIISEINKEHYIVVILNERYINTVNSSLTVDFPHDWIIYGYDNEEKIFHCAGYVERFGLRRYESIKLSYSEIAEALKKCPIFNSFTFTSKDTHSAWIKKIPNIEIDRSYIKRILYNFLNPPIISIHYRPIINLDIKAVKLLKVSLNSKIKNWDKLKNKRLWTQSFRILYENIIVLNLICKNYINNIEINKESNELSKKSYSLLLLVEKYNFYPKKLTLIAIVRYLDMFYLQEKKIIESMIESI